MKSPLCSFLALSLAALVLAPQSAIAPASAAVSSGLSASSVITTIAGNGIAAFSGDGGPAFNASINQPRDTELGPDGSIYLADTLNDRIRRISPAGDIETIAGNGSQTYNGDNIVATQASLALPHDVFVDDTGIVYIADSNHHRIRRVGLDGLITTVAGTGAIGSTGDGGPAVQARIKNPKSLVTFNGGLFFSGLDNKIRRVDLTSGVITTVAGTGTPGYSGDGGPATSAQLQGPQRIQIDSTGNIYIADTLNFVIRRVAAGTGIITTVAGTGVAGLSGDGGLATQAMISESRGLALDGDSVLYFSDSSNHRVRRIDLSTGIISPLVGTVRGFSGDGGPAADAQLYNPRGLTITSAGDLLIADTLNSRLRIVKPVAAQNQPPVARFTTTCSLLACNFDATTSSDPDGTIASYSWDYGDTNTGTGTTPAHTYTGAGSYTVTLTVTDNNGASASTAKLLNVEGNPPSGTISSTGSSAKAGSSSQPTTRIPVGALAGDRLLLALSANSSTLAIPEPSGLTGWTKLETHTAASMSTTFWTRTAQSGEAGRSVYFALSQSTKFTLTVAAYSGVAAGSLAFARLSDTISHRERTTPAVTAPAGAWVLSYWADKSDTSTLWTPPVDQATRGGACGSYAGHICSVLVDTGHAVAGGTRAGLTASTNLPSSIATTWTITLQSTP